MFCQSCGANVADRTSFCSSCGRPIVAHSVGQSEDAAAIAVAPPPVAAVDAPFAGFWLRFIAAIIDFLLLTIPIVPLFLLVFASLLPELPLAQRNPVLFFAAFLPRIVFMGVLVLALKWLYWALMESSSWQATLGKKALGLYVTDLEGRPVSFGKASGRYWSGRGLSMVPLGNLYYLVDCICCGFTEKKQAVHDMIAGCLVMRKV
jgi:uncharacterized RDD family membrane protein YckC